MSRLFRRLFVPRLRTLLVPDVQLLDLDREEDKDRLALGHFLKENKRIFQYLFGKYSSVGVPLKRAATFDAMKDKSNEVTVPSLTKMLVDYNVTHTMLSHTEVPPWVNGSSRP